MVLVHSFVPYRAMHGGLGRQISSLPAQSPPPEEAVSIINTDFIGYEIRIVPQNARVT
jgi:hypothetical protein